MPAAVDVGVVRRVERIDERLRRSRIGIIGAPPTGFEPCAGDDDQIASTFGVEVVRLGLGDLFAEATAACASCIDEAVGRVSSTLSVDPALSKADLEPSARLYCGLRHFVDDDGLAAVATRCWPECMADYGGAVCTPHAMLTEDRVPGVCEADVFGAITALVLQLVAGSDPFIADLVDIDDSDDTSVLWHCGVASSRLAHPDAVPVGTVHPNRGVALVNEFALRPGRVTVARLSQCAGGPHLVLAAGEMLDRPRPYSGTCGTIRWDLPVRDVAATIFGLGVEHHLGIVYGEHDDVLVELARRWNIPVIRLGEVGFGTSSLERVGRQTT
jgi:L-fucose isomerase-like protein